VTTVWTDLLTDLTITAAARIASSPFPATRRRFTHSSPIDRSIRRRLVVNVLTSLVGNVFGFKAVRSLRLEDLRFP